MGGSSAAKPPKETTTKTEPWSGQQPYLTYQFQQAKDIYQNQEPQYYPDQTVADVSPETQQAWDLQTQRALNGSPLIDAAQGQLQNTLNDQYLYANPAMAGLGQLGYEDQYANSPAAQWLTSAARGDYVNQNPYLSGAIDIASKPVVENYQRAIAPQTDADFVSAGAIGSGSHFNAKQAANEQLGRQLSDLSSGMTYQNYQQERANQLAAAGKMQDAYSQGIQNQTTALSDLGQEYTQERARQIQGLMSATGLADEDYKNILALGDVGAQKEGYDQAQIDAAMQKWNWEQQEPMAWLGEYANLISGGYGGTTTATNPGYYNYAKKSQLGSILGGAGSGAMAGSAAGPYGMAAGAVIGAGLGAMQ